MEVVRISLKILGQDSWCPEHETEILRHKPTRSLNVTFPDLPILL